MTKTLISTFFMLWLSHGFCQSLPEKDKLWVYIMAGQSNMAGRGLVEAQDTISNKRILTINKDMQWITAKEPLHFYEPKMVGLDCGLSFANELLKTLPPDISLAIIPCAVGGSSVEQWLGDSTHRDVSLLSNFTEKVKFAQQFGNLKGIIWHQGESNANENALPTFSQKLSSLFHNFRTITDDQNLPIVMGEIGSYAKPRSKAKNWLKLNKLLNKIAKKEENTYLVKTKDLQHKGDFVHFNSPSLRLLGNRYALQFVNIYAIKK